MYDTFITSCKSIYDSSDTSTFLVFFSISSKLGHRWVNTSRMSRLLYRTAFRDSHVCLSFTAPLLHRNMQDSLALGEANLDGSPVLGKHVTESVEHLLARLGNVDVKLLEATNLFLDVTDQ